MNTLIDKRKSNAFWELIIFVSIAALRIVISLYTLPLGTISDHTSLYYIAAKLAGFNWDDVVSNAGCYGIGFFFIFFPLFKMGLSPITIQIIMNLVIGIMVGVGAVIIFRIVDRNFNQMCHLEKVSLSLIAGSSLIVNSYVPSGGNDFILTICVLCVCYIILELLTEKDNHIKENISLLLVMGYSLTIHTRALLIYICLLLAVSIYYLITKKSIVYYWFWPAYIVEYFVVKFFLNTYRYTIWTGDIRNNSLTAGVISSAVVAKLDIYTMKAIMNTGIGIILTESSLTGGTFMFAIGAILVWGWNVLRKKEYFDEKILFLVLFSSFGFLSLSFGLGVSWLKSIYPGLASDTLEWCSGYRAFTYCRYAAPFVPLIVIMGFAIVIIYKKIFVKVYIVTVSLMSIFVIYFIYCILPYIQNRSERYFLARMMLDLGIPTDINIWYGNLLGIISPILFVFILYLLNKKKYALVIYAFLVTLFVNFERYEIFINLSSNTEINNYKMADAGFALLSNMHDELEEIESKDVYVFDIRNVSDGQIWYIYQFLNYDLHIIPTLPRTVDEECIMFTNGIVDSRYLEGTLHWQLDENEYVYCRGEKYIDILERAGVILNEE